MWRRLCPVRAPVRGTPRPTDRTTTGLPARVPWRSTPPWRPLTWSGKLALIGEDSTCSSLFIPECIASDGDSTAVSVGFAAATSGGAGAAVSGCLIDEDPSVPRRHLHVEMQMIGRGALAPKEVADLADHLALMHEAAAHQAVRVELLGQHVQVPEADTLVRCVGHDIERLLAGRALHGPVAHRDDIVLIRLAAVRSLNALLARRWTDVLALVAETAWALSDIEVAMLAEIIPPGIGVVVGGGFIQHEHLSVDTAAIRLDPVKESRTGASGRVAVAPIHERLGIGEGGRIGERETDVGIDGVIGDPAFAPEAGAGKYLPGSVIGENGRLRGGPLDRIRCDRLRLRPRRAAGDAERLEEANRDFIGVAARHFAEPYCAVGAFDRDHVGHAVAHECVAHVVFQKDTTDAGNLIEAVDRPSDHAPRLIQFIQQG